MQGQREGELALGFDPAETAGDARLVFIGLIRSPWTNREHCPKNMREARERMLDQRGTANTRASGSIPGEASSRINGASTWAEIDAPYRAGLAGLERASHVILLTWFDRAARNLIVQKPRHAPKASGTFALRSPVRPNPVGLHVVRLVALDQATGVLTLDAIDALDGTPLLDVKPYFASVDSVPDATVRPA